MKDGLTAQLVENLIKVGDLPADDAFDPQAPLAPLLRELNYFKRKEVPVDITGWGQDQVAALGAFIEAAELQVRRLDCETSGRSWLVASK